MLTADEMCPPRSGPRLALYFTVILDCTQILNRRLIVSTTRLSRLLPISDLPRVQAIEVDPLNERP